MGKKTVRLLWLLIFGILGIMNSPAISAISLHDCNAKCERHFKKCKESPSCENNNSTACVTCHDNRFDCLASAQLVHWTIHIN